LPKTNPRDDFELEKTHGSFWHAAGMPATRCALGLSNIKSSNTVLKTDRRA